MIPLSKRKKKFIRSLARKKNRQAERLFLAEGDKLVRELIVHQRYKSGNRFSLGSIIATDEWFEANPDSGKLDIEFHQTTQPELDQISLQQTPNQVIAVVHQPDPDLDIAELKSGLSMGLEYLQDPGNLGTIIRIADWFGIRHILCSEDCVELYNPKVIQSTMGSFLRVNVHYVDLKAQIKNLKEDEKFMVYGTGRNGSNLFHTSLREKGIILFGNEANGLSPAIMDLADHILTIPYHDHTSHPESLNVATAAAILCAEFSRDHSK
ncbi:MAG: RNA methyltransferase [Bacteroidales bacterium]|nr:RNA methyltransferase [Bacteroidales bacterium]